jgi:putative tryptophan/tyrosine transport system substrate-binding protein
VNLLPKVRRFMMSVAILVAPLLLPAWAEQPSRVLVLGVLFTSAGPGDPLVHAISKGLLEVGYVEGRDFRVEYRGAQGQVNRLPRLAEELVQLKVDFIIVATEAALVAAKRSTSTIPIIAALFDFDPVAAGVIDSLAHPGRNITGVFTRAPELIGKRLELLKEAVPHLSRIAVFYDSYGRRLVEDVQSASRSLDIPLVLTELTPPYNYGASFKNAKQTGAGAAMFLYSPAFYPIRESIAQQAVENDLPLIGDTSDFARAGYFMSYGTDARKTFMRLAYFIDRISKGAKPSDLPVEQPTDLEIVVNLKTARALGVMVPQSILLRANEAIR